MTEPCKVCGLVLSNDWSKRLRDSRQGEEILGNDVEFILGELLNEDLRKIVVDSNLPRRVSSMHDVVLKGNFLLQVNGCVNIAQSVHSELAEENDKDNQFGEPTNDENDYNGTNKPKTNMKRTFKLELSDGIQTVTALEHKYIQKLQGLRGEKIVAKDVPVRRGVLLLQEFNMLCLGGSFPFRVEENHVEEIPSTPKNTKTIQADSDVVDITDSPPSVFTKTEPHSTQVNNFPCNTQSVFSEKSIDNDIQRYSTCTLQNLSDGSSGFVNAQVTSISGRLKNTSTEYGLHVFITDGKVECLAELSSRYIQMNLLDGFSPSQLKTMKREDQPQYNKLMLQSGEKIRRMEGRFKIRSKENSSEDPIRFVVEEVQLGKSSTNPF